MTKVEINPGVCGLITKVIAESEDQMDVTINIESDCAGVRKLFEQIGDTLDAFEVCLGKPGTGPIYEQAETCMPGHASCPVIAGITKCIEVECKLALPATATIQFL